jgi:hypothetical protein
MNEDQSNSNPLLLFVRAMSQEQIDSRQKQHFAAVFPELDRIGPHSTAEEVDLAWQVHTKRLEEQVLRSKGEEVFREEI